jgi:hypothetical protein
MTSFEPIISAQTAVPAGSPWSEFGGGIKMGLSEQKQVLSRRSYSSTSWTILENGLATRKNGITCTSHAKPVEVVVQRRKPNRKLCTQKSASMADCRTIAISPITRAPRLSGDFSKEPDTIRLVFSRKCWAAGISRIALNRNKSTRIAFGSTGANPTVNGACSALNQ